jgi:hypothetical protein
VKNTNKFNDRYWGLLEYKPKWSLTLKGWGFILVSIVSAIVVSISQIHSFLAYNKPLPTADILVVEGWLVDEALQQAIVEFKNNNYQLLITTGLPLERGAYLSEYKNFAELSAASLIAMGFDRSKLLAIPTPKVTINRTLASAISVKKWLETSSNKYDSLNIYSDSVHTRRSFSLYRKVFDRKIEIGSIAASNSSYNPQIWWRESEGVRRVISETVAYIYAVLFG